MRPYVKPQIMRHGTVEKITEQTASGTRLDMSFGAGTNINDVTLS